MKSGMPIRAWFPTFIYDSPLLARGGGKFNAELLKECYQVRDFDRKGRTWSKRSYPGGYTSYGSMAQLHRFSSTFTELERHLDRHVNAFLKHLELDMQDRKVSMTDCWVNIMPRQVVHSLHLHPLSLVSGTYYVRTPAGCSSLKFEDPRLDRFMATPPRKPEASRANRSFAKYQPSAGRVILFESWLRHEVSANQSAEDRVSISFNYNWF